MKRRRIIAVVILAVLALLAVGIFRGMTTRELILKRNGVPLANLKATIRPGGKSSTDRNGRLDLSAVPAEAECILLSLRDNTGTVWAGALSLPPRGSRTIDFRGNRTITTTKTTYLDFGFYEFTSESTEESVQFNKPAAPSEVKPDEPAASNPREEP